MNNKTLSEMPAWMKKAYQQGVKAGLKAAKDDVYLMSSTGINLMEPFPSEKYWNKNSGK